MGTKVQIENYLSAGHHSTRDLSREYNCYNDVNMPMPNGQFYYGFLPETVADSCNGYDKDIVKQTMLKHEAIFKEQVYELHRLYRVQRDLMDEVRRTQTLKQHVSYEASSSSSALPLQMQSEDVQRCNGSSFPSTSQFFGRPFMSGPDNYQFPPNSAKGKAMQAGPSPGPLQNFYSLKNSEVSESKPSKLQKRVFDLELPADEYIDTNNNNFIDLSLSPDESRRPTSIADLNEPLNAEGLSAFSSVNFLRHAGSHADVLCRNLSARSVISSNKDTPQYSKNGNSSNGALNNSQDIAGNAQDWFYAFESGNGKSTNQGFFTQKAPAPSQPMHVPWGQSAMSWMKPDIFTQKSTSIQPNPFLCGVNHSNGLLAAKPPVINGFHPGSSAATSIDVEEMNPHGLNGCKMEDPFTVLPWLRGKGSNKGNGPDKGSENPRNGFNNSESRLKILGVSIYDNRPMPKEENHIAAVNPPDIHRQSECEEIKVVDSRKRKCLFDMNVPCEVSDSEQEKLSNEEVAGSEQKTNFRNQFDLNSCITEEETACATSLLYCSSSVKTGSNGIGIDLEALINQANEDDFPPVHDSLVNDEDSELVKAAASAIVAMSSVVETSCVSVEAEGDDDPLQWFVNIACSSSLETEEDDGLPLGLEDFEYMILRQKECTPEEYLPKPSTPDFPAIENSSSALTNTRTRKGQARRGRQKRDFQRDILPGLTTLSRNEVTEDLQTFGGLLRGTGFSWQIGSGRRTGAKNGRGRGRPRTVVVTETPPAPPAAPPSPPMVTNTVCGLTLSQKPEVVVQMTKNVEISVLEDRSLRGWGKTTRRPRRQRYPAGNPDLLVP